MRTVGRARCLQSHADEFSCYFDGDAAFKAYTAKMANKGTWGDELTLRAAADLLGCKILVVTSDKTNYILHYDAPATVAKAKGTADAATSLDAMASGGEARTLFLT